MPIDILRFPTHIFGKISNYLENKSILELRQVCKTTEKYLSSVAVNQPAVVQLQITTDFDGISQLFLFYRRNVIFWKLCLMSVFRKLKIDFTTPLSQEHPLALCITLEWSDMKKFLACAKHLFTNKNIEIALVKSGITTILELEVLHIYSEFLNGKNLQSISVIYPLTEHAQMKMWTNLIKNVHSKKAYFQLEMLNKESARFLIDISNNVESIEVTFKDRNNTADNILSIIIEMLRRKCMKIYLYGDPPLTIDQIEKLLQFANQCDKKIEISANTKLADFRYQIGVYEAVNSDGNFSLTQL